METLDLPKKIIGDISDLSSLPKNPLGYIILIEVRGGVDKGVTEEIRQKRKGHRPDTIPICNELIQLGWGSLPIYYSDDTYDLVNDFLSKDIIQGVIVRINPGTVPGVTNSKWERLVTNISNQGICVMTTPDVMKKMGAKDVLGKITGLNCGLPDTEVYYTIEDWEKQFPPTLTKKRVVKQNRGSSGEGIWVVELLDHDLPITHSSRIKIQEAVDNHTEETTLGEFLTFCHQYLLGKDGLIVNQRYCPRIIEGEIRLNMIGNQVEAIVHKKPIQGGISATLSSGAEYTQYPPDEPKFSKLVELWEKDKQELMKTLGLGDTPLPLIWTADFIFGDDDESFIIGEINCSCVGIGAQLKIMAPKVAQAAVNSVLQCRPCSNIKN